MGRVFIEEAMDATGIDRVELVGLLAFIKRSGRASSPADAIRRLEAGEFDVAELQEQMIQQQQVNRPDLHSVETDEE